MVTDKNLSDKDILEMSFENPKHFELLVLRYQKLFLRKSVSITHSKEDAEDIVQDTFLKIYKSGQRFKETEGATFKSWAYQILRNTCYSYYKKQKKILMREKLVDFSRYDVEDTSTEDMSNRSYIESIFRLMPQSLVKVLRLYFLEERSQKEIAEIENISAEAVRTRIHRAKKCFRKITLKPI